MNGKKAALLGLGLSGLATVECLVKNGIKCDVWDDDETARQKAADLGADIVNLIDTDLSGYAFLVLSPGVPLTHDPHPVVANARKAGIEIVGDLELFYRSGQAHKIIAITGTNGKSTTTALIGHILKENDIAAHIGGNIGVPVLSLDLENDPTGCVVIEASSYQLDLCHHFKPDFGILINLSPDHIDRHGTMENYREAKMRLFQNGAAAAIIGSDDKYCREIMEQLDHEDSKIERIIPVSCKNELSRGVYSHEGHLYDNAFADEAFDVGKLSTLRTLPGQHNRQNIACAYAVGRLLDLHPDKIIQALESFEGLPHRLFLVRVINGIAYVNDSKATNIDSAKRGLSCHKKIYWILGGRPKSDALEGAEEYIDRVKHAFLIGEASDEFAKWFDKREVNYTMCGNLDKAVSEAHDMAQNERGEPGGAATVLFSPACASFDQYKSFEERGDHFVELVENLEDATQST